MKVDHFPHKPSKISSVYELVYVSLRWRNVHYDWGITLCTLYLRIDVRALDVEEYRLSGVKMLSFPEIDQSLENELFNACRF